MEKFDVFLELFEERLFPCNIMRDAQNKKQVSLPKGWTDTTVLYDVSNMQGGNSIALRTGGGLLVVDIDTKDFSLLKTKMRDLASKWLNDKATFTVETTNGYHFYFETDCVNYGNAVRVSEFVDIRGEGGCVFCYTEDSNSSYTVVCSCEPLPLTKELTEYLAVKEPTQVRYSYDKNNRKIALERGDVNDALRDAICSNDINNIIQASSKRIDLEGFNRGSDGLYFRVNKLIYIWALNPAVPNERVDGLVQQLIIEKIGFDINSPETIKRLNQIYSTLIWTDESDLKEVVEYDIASIGFENDTPNLSVNFSILEQLPMCNTLFSWLQVSDDKTHPIASLTSLITIASSVTARGYYTHTNASTNLFLIMIGRSGIGKNTVVKTPNKIMDKIGQKHKIIAGKVSSEGAMDDIFKVQNVAVHVIDEFGDQLGHMLSDKGGYLKAVSSKMKNLYSLSNGIYESSRYSSAGGKKRTDDPWTTSRPCYGITGLTTEKQLLMHLNDNHVSDGFLNRFVILNGEGIDPQFNDHPIYEIPDEILSHIQSIKMSTGYTNETDKGDALLVKAVMENVKYFADNERCILPLSSEASRFYTHFIGDADLEGTDIYDYCKNDDSDTKRDIAMRWRENSLRLAVALTAFEKQDEVSFEVLQWCYTLVKNSSINFIELFTTKASQTQYEELKERAIRWFMSQNDKSKYHSLTMLSRNARPFSGMKSRERKELLEDLVESGVIELKKNRENNHETDYYRLITS